MAQSELQKRIIWGAVFGAIVIGAVLVHEYLLFGLCAAIAVIGTKEFMNLQNLKYKGLWALSSISSLLILLVFYHSMFAAVLGLWIIALLIMQMKFHATEVYKPIAASIFANIYIALPLLLLLEYSIHYGNYEPKKVLTIFFLVWSSDTFAYFTGKFLGKSPLYPALSPKKTLEGLAGGTLMAAFVGGILGYYWNFMSVGNGLILGILVSISGTAGDLFESALKRSANVKDSGKLIPGHGGILDRFDAFLFACVVVWAWEKIALGAWF